MLFTIIMKRYLSIIFFFITTIVLGQRVEAVDFSSTNFSVKDPVIKPGGGFSSSTTFYLWQTLGEEAIGFSTTTDFQVKSGFLYFPAPTTPSFVTSSPGSGTTALGGGGSGIFTLKKKNLPCDFNADGQCDVRDLSILLFYYKQSGSAIAAYDLNRNGQVDFPDLSILFYYWI